MGPLAPVIAHKASFPSFELLAGRAGQRRLAYSFLPLLMWAGKKLPIFKSP